MQAIVNCEFAYFATPAAPLPKQSAVFLQWFNTIYTTRDMARFGRPAF